MDSLAVYIHVPFCAKMCGYCDFNAYAGLGRLTGDYVDAIVAEIGHSEAAGCRVSSVSFGGGTPTFLPADQLARILDAVAARFSLDSDAEISAEANPTSSDAARFKAMNASGFNRISIGIQTFDDHLLKAIDREHTGTEAESAVYTARDAGFENISVDLMFALPGQTRTGWDECLDRATALPITHISSYALTIEPKTPFHKLHTVGKLSLPTEDDEIWMYERAIERLEAAGFDHYEVSNFARPGYRSRHNMVYWRNEEYLGFGPGAVSYLNGRRWMNERSPARYIAKARAGDELTIESEALDSAASLAETIIQGLRLRDGLDHGRIAERYGKASLDSLAPVFKSLESRTLLESNNERIRLTRKGLLLSNEVALEILP